MSRRKAAPKRIILPDPLFGSELLAKFINVVMNNGKKAVAEKVVYQALEKVVTSRGKEEKAEKGATIRTSEGLRKAALEMFEKALGTVRPVVEVRSRRVGGATYQVPMEVPVARGIALAMRWLVASANKRGEQGMASRLAGEILDALNGKGGAMNQRETAHKMAKANQAFAHFRW
jgi:small subunit ribosomal protein S7